MSKKEYRGLDVRFVSTDGMNILTQTPSGACRVISVQYYVNQVPQSVCDTESGDADPDEGYSYNWNAAPPHP